MWQRLATSKAYREEFALSLLKKMVPFQTRVLRRERHLSQAQLAESSKLTQGVISRAEDPDYGNLTLNTIGRIAAGFDLAFIGRFVQFSDLVKFSHSLTEEEFKQLIPFVEENRAFERGDDLFRDSTPTLPRKSPEKADDVRNGYIDYKQRAAEGTTLPIAEVTPQKKVTDIAAYRDALKKGAANEIGVGAVG
jgi:transcriptional regulator with XRE-family HTH domain